VPPLLRGRPRSCQYARSDDCEKALARQQSREPADDIGAADQSRQLGRQVVRVFCCGGLRRRLPWAVRERDRRDEAVAASGNIDQIPVAAAQRPAQRADLKFEIALLDKGVRPDAGHQLVLADHLARVLDQGDQNIQGAAAETNGLVALEQQPSIREKAEGAKRDCSLEVRLAAPGGRQRERAFRAVCR
jgi:hypothetical protein